MNLALESYKKKIKGKQVAVLGFGVSNRPLAGTLTDWGAFVTVFDKRKKKTFPIFYGIIRKKGYNFRLARITLITLKASILFLERRECGLIFRRLPELWKKERN